ncbi:putative response regulator [Bacillus sp. TS-2]|nr:putative response regulator [Bacillus sp. TS-2]
MVNILIAEDQTILREALTSLLNLEEDLNVIKTVGTGQQVLDYQNAPSIDLYLLDIEMPHRNGLEVAQLLKEKNSSNKVVLLTTFSRSGYIEKAIEMGVDGYLLKDEPIEQLIQSIRRVLNGEKVVSSMLGDLIFSLERNPLNDREIEMLKRVKNGESTKDISKNCHLSLGTVRNYLSTAMQKLDTTTRHDALRIAEERGWI